MTLRIADSFSTALAKLTNDEQKAAKTAAFDLQMNPAHPGLQMHRVDRAKDPNFWTARVGRDIRLVLHKQRGSTLLAWVGHHDDAYAWAERRRLEVHPKTGAAQLVEIRERVEEIVVRRVVEEDAPPALSGVGAEELAAHGVPEDWIGDALAASEDELLEIASHLPAEAAEAVLTFATGGTIEPPAPEPVADPFEHPEALRRFRVMENRETLEKALEYPWERWTVFLHPAQRDFVERDFNGPARVSGSAGTGKTVVALHRAVHLARQNPGSRVLLTTFTEALANALRLKLRRLVGPDAQLYERIDVRHLRGVALALHESRIGPVEIASQGAVERAVREALDASGASFPYNFVLDEWEDVVDAWSVRSLDEYASVKRTGRRVRVGAKQRESLWAIMTDVRARLADRGLTTWNEMFDALRGLIAHSPPYDFAVVDEAQDISASELRFLTALGRRDDALFFAGDTGQRIFRPPISWRAAGVELRGRARILKVNYRTSHQIRAQADLLLPGEIVDADGDRESRKSLISIFNGPSPLVQGFADEDAEIEGVAAWVSECRSEGIAIGEIGLVVRSADEIARAIAAAEAAGCKAMRLTGTSAPHPKRISVCTMHVAKGLEFRAVAVMACDEEVVPLASRVEAAGSEGDLEEIYSTERHLLYVACTRARDRLMVSGTDPMSEFIEDFRD